MQTDKFRQPNRLQNHAASVEKRLHIHSGKCAEAVFCSLNRFCPRSVQLGYNAFPAHPAARKPLTL
jgi:hypothetical protein